jgi:hypothetical protein
MEPSEQVNRILAALGYGGGGYTVELEVRLCLEGY